MGMFDHLKINTDKLPVSDEEKKLIGKDPGWQTKSLDCMLTTIYITDEGELQIRRFETGWDDTKKNGFGTMGWLTEENPRIETIPHHGYINFYADIKKTWYEFFAKFTDGRLVEITGGAEKGPLLVSGSLPLPKERPINSGLIICKRCDCHPCSCVA